MPTEAMMRLESSRKELLDLGLRNPLINHRQRAKQVKVVDELSTEICRILITDGRKMSFDAIPDKKLEEIAAANEGKGIDINAVNWEDLLAQPESDGDSGQLATRHTDTRLQTTLPSEKLQTRLLSIHNDARTYLEEQGVNILFLALGFLHWYEAPSSQEERRAPLILIPVEIKRASAQERFNVAYSGEDIGDNLSLSEKLRVQFNIELPLMDDGEDLDVSAYLNSVAEAVEGQDRWFVDSNEMTMGFFAFGKFLMYKDLDPKVWENSVNGGGFSILDSLLTDGFRESASVFGDEDHIDEIVSPADVHQVKDADSTQILAILDVNDGRNLVLQGPPGTGKSQTITNIIAECIGNGRKVLFVSEKMAALDVVKRRLDEVGLGDAVLELHSHKTNKKLVLAELDRTLHQGRPMKKDSSDDIETLTRLRDELNAYSTAVNKSIGNTRMSFINALGYALKHHPSELDEIQPFSFDYMSEWSESDYRASRMEVEKLDRHIANAGPLNKNPFKLSELTEFLPNQRPKFEKLLEVGKASTNVLLSEATGLAQAMGLNIPQSRVEVELICRAARRAMEAPHLEGLTLSSGGWQARSDDISDLIASGKELNKAHTLYDEWLIDDAWQQDLVEVRQHYVTKGNKWWRFFSSDFRNSKSRLQGLCRKKLHKDVTETIKMIDTILDCQKHLKRYQGLSSLGASIFGAQWKKTDSDWEVLEKLTEWVVELYRDVGNGKLPDAIVDFLSGSPKVNKLEERVGTVEVKLQKHLQIMELVVDSLKLKISDDVKTHWGITLDKQAKYLGYWQKNLESLYQLVRYNQLADELNARGLGFVVDTSKDWMHGEGTLLQLFDYSWFSGLVEKAYVETPSIKMFDRIQHTHMVEEFSRLDRLLFRHNQVRLATKHWESLPSLSSGGELQIISREINKKRRIMPIRKLMISAGRAIQAIKPVFMMGPMSIATYIPPETVEFDLVIFDEASQVKPVDAFGAIVRGNQTVVVGDSKQLPPTSFFESLVDGDDEDDLDSVGDVESILSLFLGKGAPERMLRWHYRSRHDSLIAVSNNEFYDNRLVVFPSPGANPAARGLSLHHLPDTAYDRGKTRSNPQEAKAVAMAVMKHAKTCPDLSLGVVAFSTAQRDAIELQLELLRRSDSSCEPFFIEKRIDSFFIKNLENVQGDERDVIFISIGYGKTEEGYMAMSFGPLNRDGGERRLNVLISRARLAMDVFSNFTADDIDLNRSKARGVVALKNFLAYAQTGIIQQPYSTGGEPDSPFEEEVIKALVQNGIEVEPQVGTAGFFIDIGIKDRNNPGRYILGIECDGATYHSSRSARDRDRLRQEVLEGLGWRLHRIWSTDWYRNPKQETERALAAIQLADVDYKSGVDAESKTASVKEIEPIAREEVSQQDFGLNGEREIFPYLKAALCVQLDNCCLHEVAVQDLCPIVCNVIEIESPIHQTEIIRRVTEGVGLKRAGRRIQEAVLNAVNYGIDEGKIYQNGDFVWHSEMTEPNVRDRSDLEAASRKFELISPEEIRAAIQQEVGCGYSLSEAEAMSSAARVLGFKRVTDNAKQLFSIQINKMVENGSLTSRNGILSLVV